MRISAQDKQSDVRAGIPLTCMEGYGFNPKGESIHEIESQHMSEKIGRRNEAHPICKRLESETTKQRETCQLRGFMTEKYDMIHFYIRKNGI